jgi:hypothetical protein
MPSRTTALDVDIASRSVFSKNETVMISVNQHPQTIKLEFLTGTRTSTPFRVMHKEVREFDTAQVRLTLSSDFDSVSGFLFHSSFANPSAFKFSRVARLLLSLLLGYMLIVYFSFLSFDDQLFTELFCVLLGVMGVLSCNPLALFFPSAMSVQLLDHVSIAAFVALFRMFTLFQIEMIRGRSSSPNVLLVFIAALFFGCYATVEAGATFDRTMLFAEAEIETIVVLPTEALLINFDCAYGTLFVCWLLMASIHSGGFAAKRLFVISTLTVLGLAAAAFAHVFCIQTSTFAYTLIPTMVYAAVNLVAAAFAVFFLHCEGATYYKPIQATDEERLIPDEVTVSDDVEEGWAKDGRNGILAGAPV